MLSGHAFQQECSIRETAIGHRRHTQYNLNLLSFDLTAEKGKQEPLVACGGYGRRYVDVMWKHQVVAVSVITPAAVMMSPMHTDA